ncbi:ATP-dependent sacrificial sulfur transferase LarE [Desulfotomaculum sp. 1211_IL3151]|uniref:ATP-dependent sacrificial sulfur transferase LarE n=1 Tax=Desulfotomaculum sp. 1211_IL3151 TaxID=3084055 RepID=UPI002FD9F5B9
MEQLKQNLLREKIKNYQKALVAFSGGIDSTLLLKIASEEIPTGVLAVTAVSDTFTEEELQRTRELTKEFGVEHLIIQSNEMADARFVDNSPERCYYCKHLRFRTLKEIARSRGIENVLDGSNVDDLADYRPGQRAIKELGVKSPLQEVGLTKAEIRELARKKGIATWQAPAIACLASRIHYGETITKEKLYTIKEGEAFLRDLGFFPCRLRLHGNLARIEVPSDRLLDLMTLSEQVTTYLKKLGLTYVTLDMMGLRSGSMNEAIKGE